MMFEKNMHQLEEMRSRVHAGGEEGKEVKELKEMNDNLGVGYVQEDIFSADGNRIQ